MGLIGTKKGVSFWFLLYVTNIIVLLKKHRIFFPTRVLLGSYCVAYERTFWRVERWFIGGSNKPVPRLTPFSPEVSLKKFFFTYFGRFRSTVLFRLGFSYVLVLYYFAKVLTPIYIYLVTSAFYTAINTGHQICFYIYEINKPVSVLHFVYYIFQFKFNENLNGLRKKILSVIVKINVFICDIISCKVKETERATFLDKT